MQKLEIPGRCWLHLVLHFGHTVHNYLGLGKDLALDTGRAHHSLHGLCRSLEHLRLSEIPAGHRDHHGRHYYQYSRLLMAAPVALK